MLEELKKQRERLNITINELSDTDTHLGVYYKGYVGEYLHEGTTNVIKGYLEKSKKEIIEKLKKRVSEIDESIVELSNK